ncbi:MAG: hypothetical protein ABI837_02920 [Acidobacteriota bacterium]
MSLGFRAALLGIAMTLLSWFGPWAWPAWPAFAAIDLVFGHAGFADLPLGVGSAVVAGLIVLNVTVWGAIAWAATRAVQRVVARRRP